MSLDLAGKEHKERGVIYACGCIAKRSGAIVYCPLHAQSLRMLGIIRATSRLLTTHKPIWANETGLAESINALLAEIEKGT